MSQLSLAHLSGTSPRHISFLETGRARPGKDIIAEFANVLHLSLRDVNALMFAAGLPKPNSEDHFYASAEMAPFRKLIDHLVHSSPVYPCSVVDKYWRVQDANLPQRVLWKALNWNFEVPDTKDVVDRVFLLDPTKSNLINRDEVARQFVHRLRCELSMGDSFAEVESLAEKVERKISYSTDDSPDVIDDIPPTILCKYRIGEETLSTVVGISRFGGTPSIELDELRLIWYVPADPKSDALMARLLAEDAVK